MAVKLDGDYRLTVGRLGSHLFRKGFYVYVGSAQRNLMHRLRRHLSEQPNSKKFHWHIDYLLEHARIRYIWGFHAPKQWECRLGHRLAGLGGAKVPLKNFGSSDCGCNTHLYYVAAKKSPALSKGMLDELCLDGYSSFFLDVVRLQMT